MNDLAFKFKTVLTPLKLKSKLVNWIELFNEYLKQFRIDDGLLTKI